MFMRISFKLGPRREKLIIQSGYLLFSNAGLLYPSWEAFEAIQYLAKLREMQSSLDTQVTDLRESKRGNDQRFIFVDNVDYDASPEKMQAQFQSCGSINRVTILLDKITRLGATPLLNSSPCQLVSIDVPHYIAVHGYNIMDTAGRHRVMTELK